MQGLVFKWVSEWQRHDAEVTKTEKYQIGLVLLVMSYMDQSWVHFALSFTSMILIML